MTSERPRPGSAPHLLGDGGPGRGTARGAPLIATLCGAQVLEVLGVTVVIVALPEIGRDVGLEGGSLQLVVSLYAVLYGALLLTAGRAADVLGRRRTLAAGLVVTCAGAVTCALAATPPVLLTGRAVQGLGGALVTPAALALLTTAFPSGGPRRTAMRAWTAAAAGGGALGFGVGGVVVGAVGWRPVFWALGAVAAAVLVAVRFVVPPSGRARERRGLDPAGTVTAVAGLVLLVLGAGLVEDPDAAPVPPAAVLVLGAALLGAFVLTQRFGRDPLLGWAALTDGPFLLANGVAFVNTATTSASGTLVALVAADVLGLGPSATGLALLPFSVMVVVGSLVGGPWLRRPRWAGMSAGLAVVALSLGGMALATATGSVVLLGAAVAIAGLGLSWSALTSTDAATAALPDAQQGTAAGAVNTAAQVGTALGVAALLTTAAVLNGDSPTAGDGYVAAFLVAAALAAATALALAARRPGRRSGP